MKKLIASALIGSMLFATGCATQTGLLQKNSQTVPKSSESQAFFLWGIGQEKTTDAAKVCGDAAAVTKVQTVQEPMDIVLSVVTFGLYAPRTAKVYCKQ
jgi:hypothetical protein